MTEDPKRVEQLIRLGAELERSDRESQEHERTLTQILCLAPFLGIGGGLVAWISEYGTLGNSAGLAIAGLAIVGFVFAAWQKWP